MKKLILLFLFLLLSSTSLQARAKYQNFAQKGGKNVKTSTTTSYNLLETYPACTITVYKAGTNDLATIYFANGTVQANPFFADSTAGFSFYADNGKYDINFSGTGIVTPFVWSDIVLADITEPFNVTNFGAICDGSTNTTSAISDTIAAISALSGYPGKLQLPVGRCVVGTITIPNYVIIDYTQGGSWSVIDTQVLTIVGPEIGTDLRTLIYSNTTSGHGTISFAGNKTKKFYYPENWGDSATNVGPFFNATNLAACSASIAAGEISLAASRAYTSSDPINLGSVDAFTTISLGGASGLFGGIIYTGTGVAVNIIKGRFNYLHDVNIIKSGGGRGTSTGVLAAGPNGSLQTAHVHTERVTISGFHKGWEAGDANTSSAADECFFTKVGLDDNDYGFYAASNFNDIKYEFTQCTFALNGYGIYTSTGTSVSLTGSNGGSNTIADIYDDIGGDSLIVNGWDAEVSKQFLILRNGASAHISGVVFRSYSLDRNDNNTSDNALIDIGGGKIFVDTLYQGSNFKSTGATGPHLFRLRGGQITAINITTTDNHPIYVNPVNGEDDGSFYHIENVTIHDNMTNGSLSHIACEEGVIIWPDRVPYRKCENLSGSSVQHSAQVDIALTRGISATPITSKNLRGQYTFVGGDAGIKAITFKRTVTDGAITANNWELSSATANFNFLDVGRKVYISKAGPTPRVEIYNGNPTNGAQAIATINSSGVVTSVALQNTCDASGSGTGLLPCSGYGYSSAPTVNIVDRYGVGSGAVATATISGGKVTGFTLVNGGTNYGYFVAPIKDLTNSTTVRTATLAFLTASSATVTIGENEPDTNYVVVVTGNANETFRVTNKTTAGFTITSSNAASTATVDWILVR